MSGASPTSAWRAPTFVSELAPLATLQGQAREQPRSATGGRSLQWLANVPGRGTGKGGSQKRSCSFRSLGAMAVFAAVPSAGILRANTFHPSGPAPHDKAL